MLGLDETDNEILRLLLDDARRPYSDIAERVGLSPPAVSDRVDRLQEMGVIQGFTLDLDRSVLETGVPVLIEIEATPGRDTDIARNLVDAAPVERVFRTADGRVVLTARVPQTDVDDLLADHLSLESVARYDVRLLAESARSQGLGEAVFAPDCAECGNTVDEEGERRVLDSDV